MLVNRFHMIWVEDGFHSNDYDSFAALNARVKSTCLVCADDIYATNPERTERGIKAKSAGAMIVKTNQVGTITGAETTSRLAQVHGVSPCFPIAREKRLTIPSRTSRLHGTR